jgi:hypothetical protein
MGYNNYIELGCAPCDESCAQVGEPGFRERARKEMDAYINQLYREFPDLRLSSVFLKKMWVQHDFGVYGEVIAEYGDDDESYALAVQVENYLPCNWDEEAILELGL